MLCRRDGELGREGAGAGGGWSRRGLPVPASTPRVLGCRAARGGPTTALQEHFGPQLGLGSTGQEMGPGLAGRRRRSLKSQRCAVAPVAGGPPRGSSGEHRDAFSLGTPALQGKLRHGQSAAQQEPSTAMEVAVKAPTRCLLSLTSWTQGVGEEKNSFALIFTKLLIELR